MAERGAAASKRRPRRRRSAASRMNACSTAAQIPYLNLNDCCTMAHMANPSWGSKRARSTASNCSRDWANLAEGPAGLIADRVLANDVADYIRFRAVCRPWRHCSTDPRGHAALNRRFHPRQWVMLREKLACPYARRFLNVSTGECIKTDLLELRDHDLLGLTAEGLLILLHKRAHHVRLLNPLTRQLMDLPPVTTLMPPEQHEDLLSDCTIWLRAWGSGIAADSSVVLCFHQRCIVAIAKPGDERWASVRYKNSVNTTPLMFAGRFYCLTENGVWLLHTSADQPPRLEVAAKLRTPLSAMAMDSAHLVNNNGELMLVHRARRPHRNTSRRTYDIYKVDLDAGALFPVKSLGGRALFMGMYCSLSVSTDSFPSISGDTIYLSFDFKERVHDEKIEAYHLPNRSMKSAHYMPRRTHKLVPGPHTIVDCFSLCNTFEPCSKDLASIICT